MSHVYFIGDLHFGHTNIYRFRPFKDEKEHRAHLFEKWAATITKRDAVFVMGDAAFTHEGLLDLAVLPGRKLLVRGNHDTLPTTDYLKVFAEVYGIISYKKTWLTHAPIHPTELRGRINIHGHCHAGGPDGVDYFNTCAEFINYAPIRFDAIMQEMKRRKDNGNT